MSQQVACAGRSCSCQVSAAAAVREHGQLYCSQGCAEGRGCDHAGCSCHEVLAGENDRKEAGASR
jgi:hypothetical protein